MKYAIYGVGALGTVLAAYLAEAGETFDCIVHSDKTAEIFNTEGARVIGKRQMRVPVTAVKHTDVTEKYDIVFLLTKQLTNGETVPEIATMLEPDGVICTMQNGLPEAQIAEVVGKERTFGCTIGWGATNAGAGVSELTSEPVPDALSFGLGSYAGIRDEHFDEIVRILSIMGEVEIEDNFIGTRWVKLLVNSAFSGMSAVCGETFGTIAKNKKSRKIIQKIIKECIDVAKAADIKIEKIQGTDVAKLFDYKGGFKKKISFMLIPLAIKKHRALKASMLQDIEKDIPCEIDFINGIVCDFGKKYQIPTPVNDKVCEIVHKIEAKELKPDFNNVKLF